MEEVSDLEPMIDEGNEVEEVVDEDVEPTSPISLVNQGLRRLACSFTPWMALFVVDGSMIMYSCVMNLTRTSIGLIAAIELVRSCGPGFKQPPSDVCFTRYKDIMYSEMGSTVYNADGAPEPCAVFMSVVTQLNTLLKRYYSDRVTWLMVYEEGHKRCIVASNDVDENFPIILLTRVTLQNGLSVAPYVNKEPIKMDVELMTNYKGDALVNRFLE